MFSRAKKVRIIAAFLALLFIVSTILSLSIGSGDYGFTDVINVLLGKGTDTSKLIILEIRLPKVLCGIIVGASLSLAGVGMQSLFRNPLAEPSILGVSSGAALGAVIALAFCGIDFSIEICALISGVLAALVVCKLGGAITKGSTLSTLLAGIAVNAFCGAIVGFFMYSARELGLRGYVFWSLGSLDRCDYPTLITTTLICIPSWVLMMLSAHSLNLMLLGKQQAFHSGTNITMVWLVAGGAATAMTASSVSACGIIGFVGLVVPHIMRILTGADNRTLMPLSAIAGAIMLLLSDSLARAISPSDPVPIGVITALVGAPFFAYLLVRSRKGNQDD